MHACVVCRHLVDEDLLDDLLVHHPLEHHVLGLRGGGGRRRVTLGGIDSRRSAALAQASNQSIEGTKRKECWMESIIRITKRDRKGGIGHDNRSVQCANAASFVCGEAAGGRHRITTHDIMISMA